MVMVWAANVSLAATLSGVRIVETFGEAVAWVDHNPDESPLVIGPDVRFIDATAFAGYVHRLRPGTPVVLVRHPDEADVADEARAAGIAELVLSSSTAGMEAACPGALQIRQAQDRAPISPTVFRSRQVTTAPAAARPARLGTTVTADAAELLASSLRDRLNVVISGPAGAGKTTLLTSMAALVATDERLVTIVESGETHVPYPHVARLHLAPLTVGGAPTPGELVATAMAMHPDRLVVDELRADVAAEFIDAITTAGRGSLATLRADSPQHALDRLESLLTGPGAVSTAEARAQLAAAIDVLVHIARMPDGTRRVTHIATVRRVTTDTLAIEHRFVLADSAVIS